MKTAHLLSNTRFYILATSLLLSIFMAAWLRLEIPSDQVYYIRLQQVFGLLCVLYWYVALMISPVGYVIGKHRMKRIEFARRAIGVSAAYFAVLHGSIAVWGQLGGVSELLLLPDLFKWSLLAGGFALLILLVMAATSFDKVVKLMTFKRWKLLHRLVYIGWVLVILHIWTIGTHLAYSGVQWAAFAALAVLAGFELYKIVRKLNEKYFHLEKAETVTLFVSSWLLIAGLILMTPLLVQNYHSKHADHSENLKHDKANDE